MSFIDPLIKMKFSLHQSSAQKICGWVNNAIKWT